MTYPMQKEIASPADEQPRPARRTPNFRLRSDPTKLLAVALDEFSRKGFSKARVEDVTRQLGLTKTALYAHFPSKRALLDRVIEEYCLSQELAVLPDAESIKCALLHGTARQVLILVFREWSSVQDIGRYYQNTVVWLLSKRGDMPGPEELRELVKIAVSGAIAEIMLGPA